MQYFEKVDKPALKALNQENIFTSIQLKPDGFLFSIHALSNNEVIGFGNYKFDDVIEQEDYQIKALEDIFSSNELLQAYNYKCALNICGRKTTILPKIYFNPDQLKNYLEVVFKLDYLDEIHYGPIKHTDAYLVYAVPNQIVNFVSAKFKTIKIVHPLLSMPDKFISLSKAYNKHVAYINIERQHVEFMLVNKENILQYNNFPHTTEDDIVFYVLNALKKNKSSDALVFITGNSAYNGAEFTLLKKYIGKIYQFDPSDYLNFSSCLENMPKHYHSTLFLQTLCE